MTPEQKQRAMQMLRRFSQTTPMTRTADNAAVAMAALLQDLVDAPEPEPFGYFKSEPFGWTDCAETDDGAIALYTATPVLSVNVQTGDVYEFITSLKKPTASERNVRTIDLTPTWGEIGKLVCTLTKSNEQAALETIWPEVARAFALAAGLKAIYDELPAELKAKANAVVEIEMNKQGY